MSKKHKAIEQSQAHSAQYSMHATEYRIIKLDLLRVVILNAVYLVVILSLYFTNKSSHYLDNWFAKLLHF